MGIEETCLALSARSGVLLLAATVGSQIGFGQQKVEMMPGFAIPLAPRGLWGKKLPTSPSISTPPKASGSASSS